MLKKKYVIQKSIRIDAQLSEDLERLAKVLDRPQSELINLAIENLIHDNRNWFSRFYYIDKLNPILSENKKARTRIDGQFLSVEPTDDDSYHLIWNCRYENEVVDSLDEIYDDDELDEILIKLAENIDPNCEKMQEYLDYRLDYK